MMFSDNYCEADVYSLVKQKKLYSSSRFPWRYTGLCNAKYLPTLDLDVVEKLNKYITFHHYVKLSDAEPLKNEYKYLTINHIDGEIISYETASAVRLNTALKEGNLGYFCKATDTVALKPLMRELISYVPSENNYHCCYLNGFTYDAEGEYTGVTFRRAHEGKNITGILENDPDLDEKLAKHHEEWRAYTIPEGNSFLKRLQDTVTRNGSCFNPSLVKKVDGKLHYRLNYVKQEYAMRRSAKETPGITVDTYDPTNALRDRFPIPNWKNSLMLCQILSANDLLSVSELEYIDSVISDCMTIINTESTNNLDENHWIKDVKLAFEFVFKDNQLVDILMTRYQYHTFDKIEVPMYSEQRMIDLGMSEEAIKSVYPD